MQIIKSAIEENRPVFADILVMWWSMRHTYEDANRLSDYLHGARMMAPAFSEEESELTALWEIVVDYIMENHRNENA